MLQCQHSKISFLTSPIITSNLINTGFKTLPSAYFHDFLSLITYLHQSHHRLSLAQQYLLCLIFQADPRPVVSSDLVQAFQII